MAIYGDKSAPCGKLDRHDLCRIKYELNPGTKAQTSEGLRELTTEELAARPVFTCRCSCHSAAVTTPTVTAVSNPVGGEEGE